MNRTLAYTTIIATAAFAGNMINIGLSYGPHWKSLPPVEFMQTFAVDFPHLLIPTATTLLPAFIGSLVLYFRSEKGSAAKHYWLCALIGLLVVNIQTVAYHLPMNLEFMAGTVDPSAVASQLNGWLISHWVRIGIALASSVFALKALEASSHGGSVK
ncbi:MAG: DUF1772 domain-containing protein [Flavobacteriales bacterium]|nr:DUF1772 domain-containing protein [Flavobacteriales bacterium]